MNPRVEKNTRPPLGSSESYGQVNFKSTKIYLAI